MLSRRFGDRMICFPLETVTLGGITQRVSLVAIVFEGDSMPLHKHFGCLEWW